MLLVHDLNKDLEKEFLPCLNSDTKVFSKEMSNIHPCIGCFNCWIKTPGKCVINDDYTEIPKYIVQNDIYLVISSIRYGCYSPYIKNFIDRSIGFLLPFFRLVNGEIHHAIRYDKIPKLVYIGYGDHINNEEKETFKNLVQGNAINFGRKTCDVFFAENIESLKTILLGLKEDKR
ncbi:flavodoxin family protein [uncultured Clostridium sp.]|uniref:flavodoxin family protein n=1 Tax=uncultured Clostridium sp. TaxID=59620 RepID=UPI0025D974D1|nr:flavodoxin family protein [uncultured Clostridium sp.]